LWITIAILVVSAVTVHVTSMDGLHGEVFLCVFGDDTEYARGYSDDKFRAIMLGDPLDRVLLQLGDPLEAVDDMEGKSRVLFYTRSPRSTHYRRRALRITNGVVEKVIAGLYVD
jgi:hypothetical protein